MIITVERLRLYAYAGVWTTIITGVILTQTWAGIDKNDTLLRSVYGIPPHPSRRRRPRSHTLTCVRADVGRGGQRRSVSAAVHSTPTVQVLPE